MEETSIDSNLSLAVLCSIKKTKNLIKSCVSTFYWLIPKVFDSKCLT